MSGRPALDATRPRLRDAWDRACKGLSALALGTSLIAGGLVLTSEDADAHSADIESPEDASVTPAVKYASLDQNACEAELTRRSVPFVPVPDARGVLAPVRLTGPLHGVTYRSTLPEKQRASSPWEILDCRLVLALDDFAELLARHDVREVVHFSVYRPPPVRGWIEGMLGKRHSGALAIDAGRFIRNDGTTLDVDAHFGGRPAQGNKPCGPKAAAPAKSAEGQALRAIVCESAEKHLFNVALTPFYNKAHKNHLHLEVTPGVKWFLIH